MNAPATPSRIETAEILTEPKSKLTPVDLYLINDAIARASEACRDLDALRTKLRGLGLPILAAALIDPMETMSVAIADLDTLKQRNVIK